MNNGSALALPEFAARMIGIGDECAGRPMAFELQSQAGLPVWVSLSLLALLAAVATAVYFLERRGAGWRWAPAALRVALLGVVVLMLQGWVVQPYCTEPPEAAIVIDVSASMQIEDAYDQQRLRRAVQSLLPPDGELPASRLNLAKRLLSSNDAALLEEIAGDYKIKLYVAGSSLRGRAIEEGGWDAAIAPLEATDTSSRIGSILQDVIEAQRGRPTAAVVVFTDGAVTEGISMNDAGRFAAGRGVPLFLVGMGGDKPPRDAALSDLLADDVVFVDDLVHFDFRAGATGFNGQKAEARLKRAGQSAVLAQREVAFDDENVSQAVRLSHRPQEKGEFEYVVELAPLEGEASTENNALSKTVRVTDETIRVLLVQAYPSWEYRALKNLLTRGLQRAGGEDGKSFELSTVLQDADVEYVQLDETARRVMPVDREDLFQYDVIVFGDVDPVRLSESALQSVADFVQIRGGGLVFIAGMRYTPWAYRNSPLEALFPFPLDSAPTSSDGELSDGEFRVAITQFGLQSPLMQISDTPREVDSAWSELPGLRWSLETPPLNPTARVLAEIAPPVGASTSPLVVMHYVGAGKVVFIGADETYRWAGLDLHDDRYYARFWTQTLRSLARAKILGKSRQAEIVTDRAEYRQGDEVRLRVRFFDDRLAPPEEDGVTIVLENSEGVQRRIVLRRMGARRGDFNGSAPPLAAGSYRLWLESPALEGDPPEAQFAVTAPPGEFDRLQMEAAELRRTAATSGGRFYTIADVERLPGDLPRAESLRIEALPPRPIWNGPIFAAAFIALITAEWLLRRRAGLV